MFTLRALMNPEWIYQSFLKYKNHSILSKTSAGRTHDAH